MTKTRHTKSNRIRTLLMATLAAAASLSAMAADVTIWNPPGGDVSLRAVQGAKIVTIAPGATASFSLIPGATQLPIYVNAMTITGVRAFWADVKVADGSTLATILAQSNYYPTPTTLLPNYTELRVGATLDGSPMTIWTTDPAAGQ